jgi:hypothetical protein
VYKWLLIRFLDIFNERKWKQYIKERKEIQKTNSSNNKVKHNVQHFCLDILPDLVIIKIMSFLSGGDAINFGQYIPAKFTGLEYQF